MYKKLSLMILAASITIVVFNSCEKGTEPEVIKPGRRDYTWTVDTLDIFATYLSKMWGTSPTNVWAVGNGGSLDDDIWHYDGVEWGTDGISRLINPWCIYGFAKNDIWVGGEDGEIWHYDGTVWSENLRYQNSDYQLVYFIDIWGESSSDIYAVGFADSSNIRFGIMMHYNGTKWDRVDIEFTEGIFMKIRKANKTSDNFFIWNTIQNPDSTKFCTFNGKKIDKIYCEIGATQTLTVIDDEVLFNFNSGIYIYSSNNFSLIAKNSLPNAWDAVYGRNRKDIIWAMSDGLSHYNGTDFKYILNFDNKSLSDGVVFKNDVFFVANDFYNGKANNLIYHGVLK